MSEICRVIHKKIVKEEPKNPCLANIFNHGTPLVSDIGTKYVSFLMPNPMILYLFRSDNPFLRYRELYTVPVDKT